MALKTNLLFVGILVSISACSEQQTTRVPIGVNKEARQQRLALEKKYDVSLGAFIKITDVIGKSLKQVEKVLGKPDKIEKPNPDEVPCGDKKCNEALYQNGKYEVVFIHGKADWITINELSDFNLNEEAIKLLGFPALSPTFNNPSNVLRWENLEGIKEISFFNNGSDKIGYVYIKAKTD